MNISSPFIKRPVMTSLVMLTILFFGCLSYLKLPVSDLPNIEYPTITVQAQQPGGSPQYMADTISMPLERNFATISGLNTMSSSSTNGTTSIVLNFDLDVDINQKQVEVSAAIQKTQSNLPPMPNPPTFQKTNPAEAPILYITLTSPIESLSSLYEYAYNLLAQPLSMIEGVSQVQVYGYPYAIRVQVNPMKLKQYALDFSTVAHELVAATPNLASGKIREQCSNILLETHGQITDAETYNEIILKQHNKTPLRVKDIGQAINSYDQQREPHIHSIEGNKTQNAIVLAISRLSDSNTIAISKAILSQLPILQQNLPTSIHLSIFYDKAATIIASVDDVKVTLYIAFILVILVIYFYLGKWIETLIPSAVLPLSLMGTTILMYFWHFNIDNLSLLAMTIAIGFVVDDAIVVLENIVRHMEMGKKPYQAALDGSQEINVTVISITLSLAAVFIPMIWMPGMLGRVFNEFSLTLVFAILTSGVISLTLNPMLCSLLLRPNSKKIALFERFHTWTLQVYEKKLSQSFSHKKLILSGGVLCLVLSLLLVILLPKDFLPPTNSDILQGLTLAAEGSSMHNTSLHQKELEKLLLNNPYIDRCISACGINSDEQGLLVLHLIDPKKRPPAYMLAWMYMQKLAHVVGIQSFFKPLPLVNLQVGTGNGLGDYQYTLYSLDEHALYTQAASLLQKMQSMPELVGINSDLKIKAPQRLIEILRDQASMYHISAEQIEQTIQYAFAQNRITTFNRGSNLYNLFIEILPSFELEEKTLHQLYVTSDEGAQVPLSSLVRIQPTIAPLQVNHTNLFPSVTISFNLAAKASLGPVIKKLHTLALSFPPTIHGTMSGSGQVFITTFQAMRFLIFVSIFIIFIILGILYEGILHPLIILSSLPLATCGGFLTLWIFREPLSLYSVVGLIVLIGLVQKNGIMMVDFALDHIKNQQSDPQTAILQACKERFRPIMMTTLTTIFAAIPVAVGIGANGTMNRPLGLVLVGGLFFSQALTLFFTPTLFVYLERWRASSHQRHLSKINGRSSEIS